MSQRMDRKTLATLIEAEDISEVELARLLEHFAADEMIDSRWYRQVKSRGVTLAAMMRTNQDPPWLR